MQHFAVQSVNMAAMTLLNNAQFPTEAHLAQKLKITMVRTGFRLFSSCCSTLFEFCWPIDLLFAMSRFLYPPSRAAIKRSHILGGFMEATTKCIRQITQLLAVVGVLSCKTLRSSYLSIVIICFNLVINN